MKVHELMDAHPPMVLTTTTVREVAALLVKHNIDSAPVVDEEMRLLGIVSEGDLLYKKVRPQAPHYVNLLGASIFYGGLRQYNKNVHKLLATECKDLMTTDVIVCHEEEDIESVAAVMVEQHLKMLPVVKDERVVGVLRRKDIIALIAQEEE